MAGRAASAHKLGDKERTQDIEIEEDITFSDLLLSDAVLAGLHLAGFQRPSPIQLAAIPLGRCGLDLVVQAKSGTGKTCVLAVIALETVSVASSATQVLVVAPTREVAVQVSQVVSGLASGIPGLQVAVFIGGVNLAEDRARLKRCHVAVGTPGRLAQLVSLGLLRLDRARLLVLDEADRLLEEPFFDPVTQLATALPHNKQVLCLSATFSAAAAERAESLMRSPAHVRLGRDSPALLGVNQLMRQLAHRPMAHLRHSAKVTDLLALLSSVTFNQCLVFSGSQLRAESVCHRLQAEGWPATHLSGAQSQGERLAALEALQSHKCRILVATDLASRGLDSPHVNLVVSLDLAPDPATYLHRAGRAGRYGARGAAVTLVSGGEEWRGARALATLANVRLLLLADTSPRLHLATEAAEGLREVEGLPVEEARDWLHAHAPYRRKTDLTQPTQEKQNSASGKRQDNVTSPTSDSEKENKQNNRPRKTRGSKYKEDNNGGDEGVSTAKREGKTRKRKTEGSHRVEKDNHNTRIGSAKSEGNTKWKEGEEEESKESPRMMENQGDGEENDNNLDSERKEAKKVESQMGEVQRCDISVDRQTENRERVMRLLEGMRKRPPPTTVSYPQLLLDCEAQYDTHPSDTPPVRVPPWPHHQRPSLEDLMALERYLEGVREQGKEWDGGKIDTNAALQALVAGKDGNVVLEEVREKKKTCPPPIPLPHILRTPSSGSEQPSPSPPTQKQSTQPVSDDHHHISPSPSTPEQSTHPSHAHKHSPIKSKSPVPHPASRAEEHQHQREELPQPASGTCRKEKKRTRKQKHRRNSSANQTNHSNHQGYDESYQAYDESYQAYDKNYQAYDRSDQGHIKGCQGYERDRGYNKDYQASYGDYQGYDEGYGATGYQGYSETYQGYEKGYQGSAERYSGYNRDYQGYQDYCYEGSEAGYQDSKVSNSGHNYDNYNRAHRSHEHSRHKDQQRHYNPRPHHSHSTAYHSHRYTHTPLDTSLWLQSVYVESACKFASMLDYVRTMARMSECVARDYYSRRGDGSYD